MGGFGFSVQVTDKTGVSGAYMPVAKTLVEAALGEYARYIHGRGSIDVEIRIDTMNGSAQTILVIGTSNTPQIGPDFVRNPSLAPQELMTGTDPNGSQPDITIVLNPLFFSKYWTGDQQTLPSDKIDGLSKLIGELKWAFNVFTSTDAISGSRGTAPNGQLRDDAMFHNIAKIDGGWYFVGANAQAIYGGPVPIGAPDIDGAIDLGVLSRSLAGADVFANKAAYSTLTNDPNAYESLLPGTIYRLSPLDLAIIKDLNPGLAVAIPKKGTASHDVFGAVRGEPDMYDGREGRDTVLEQGSRADYTISVADGSSITVASKIDANDVDLFTNVERIRFADGVLIFDAGPHALPAYRLYQAAFARVPDEAGLLVQSRLAFDPLVQEKAAAGASLTEKIFSISQAQYYAAIDVAARFIASAEFASRYGTNVSDGEFVDLLYHNVLGRSPDDAGRAHQIAALEKGLSRATLLTNFAESPENVALTASNTANGLWSVFPDPAYA
jgi:Domain of unknown function (DUF4214)